MFNTTNSIARYNGGGGGGTDNNSNTILDHHRRSSDMQVQYEIAVPVVTSYRHTPYHSLWDIHQW